MVAAFRETGRVVPTMVSRRRICPTVPIVGVTERDRTTTALAPESRAACICCIVSIRPALIRRRSTSTPPRWSPPSGPAGWLTSGDSSTAIRNPRAAGSVRSSPSTTTTSVNPSPYAGSTFATSARTTTHTTTWQRDHTAPSRMEPFRMVLPRMVCSRSGQDTADLVSLRRVTRLDLAKAGAAL